jgi:Fe-S-cluster containining protein
VGADPDLPAGDFGAWLAGTRAAARGAADAVVPCDGCTACCTSSQFVHIGPDEVDTLAHVPPELLVPAPGRPPGHVVLGYDDRGHCPMLRDGRCSIYDHRPRTCRTYDCRVFAATGIHDDEGTKVEITRRVRRWRFDVTGVDDATRLAAVRAAAVYLDSHAADLGDAVPAPAASRAALALALHARFLGRGPDSALVVIEPDITDVRRAIADAG